ncbi:phage tail protein [Methylobacillus glycogenes]|uniref:phage tail protein n=1 Tax=Methylobacillus glycogenes TaxID=406 RepID=UPI00046F0F95|nr:phage tail protein [Methylobacillus glycogenes]
MLKPQSIRTFLQSKVPALNQSPDNFLTFIEGGQLVAALGDKPSFVYHYKLTLAILDFNQHADKVMIPLIIWIKDNQPELLNGEANGHMTFEAEILNNDTADITISIDLTERVRVDIVNDEIIATHCPEPNLAEIVGPTNWTMYTGDVQVQATQLT